MAALEYENSKQKMPGSWAIINGTYTAPSGTQTPVQVFVNWVQLLMPYLGRNDLYASIQNGQSIASGTSTPTVGTLTCPSNAGASTFQSPLQYVANCGRPDTPNNNSGVYYALDSQENGVFFDQIAAYNGVSYPVVTTSVSYIARWDGTTNTLLLSENIDEQQWYYGSASPPITNPSSA